MRVLCLTLHIGARDIQWCLEQLGHTCDIASYSGHSHIMGWTQKGVDWDLPRLLDAQYCKAWYDRHPEYHGYDAYIGFYEPVVSLLFAKSGKPVVMCCPVRYGFPFQSRLDELNEVLHPLIDSGVLTMVANGRYDQKYAEENVDREVLCIESLCAYVGNSGYGGQKAGWVVDSRVTMPECKGTINKSEALPAGHLWNDIGKYSGFVMLPYNASQMSFYERYWLNMPHLFPSEGLMWTWSQSRVLQELTWFGCSVDYSLMDWFQYPHLEYFDSVSEYARKVQWLDTDKISERIRLTNIERKKKVLGQWEKLVQSLS